MRLYNGEAERARTHATAAIDAVGATPPNRGLFPVVHAPLIRANIQAGELDAARAAVERASVRTTGNALADEVRIPAYAAFVAAADGELSRAEHLAAAVERRADALHLRIGEPGRIMAGLARVESRLERNEWEAAGELLDAVRAGAEASHRAPFQSLVALHEARLSRATGDQEAAQAQLLQARLLLAHPDETVQRVFAEELVQQALRFEPAHAPALIEVLDPSRIESQLLRVRQLLIDGSTRAAADALTPLPAPTSRRLSVERDVLWALAWLDRDVETANDHLRQALLESRPERLIRSIIDPGVDVHKLLMACTPDSELGPYVEDLLSASSQVVAPRRTEVPRRIVEPLSAREVTVLRYLCSRLTYEEIAAALFVSLNTLKSHVKSVYRKLGVASRAEAVAAGRELRVI
jgi:LuxR family maltose regulon positive regulatory protein